MLHYASIEPVLIPLFAPAIFLLSRHAQKWLNFTNSRVYNAMPMNGRVERAERDNRIISLDIPFCRIVDCQPSIKRAVTRQNAFTNKLISVIASDCMATNKIPRINLFMSILALPFGCRCRCCCYPYCVVFRSKPEINRNKTKKKINWISVFLLWKATNRKVNDGDAVERSLAAQKNKN